MIARPSNVRNVSRQTEGQQQHAIRTGPRLCGSPRISPPLPLMAHAARPPCHTRRHADIFSVSPVSRLPATCPWLPDRSKSRSAYLPSMEMPQTIAPPPPVSPAPSRGAGAQILHPPDQFARLTAHRCHCTQCGRIGARDVLTLPSLAASQHPPPVNGTDGLTPGTRAAAVSFFPSVFFLLPASAPGVHILLVPASVSVLCQRASSCGATTRTTGPTEGAPGKRERRWRGEARRNGLQWRRSSRRMRLMRGGRGWSHTKEACTVPARSPLPRLPS